LRLCRKGRRRYVSAYVRPYVRQFGALTAALICGFALGYAQVVRCNAFGYDDEVGLEQSREEGVFLRAEVCV
jgi:hypothetical protein